MQAEEELARVRGQYESLLQETHQEIRNMDRDVRLVQHSYRHREEAKDQIIQELKARVLNLKEELRQFKSIVSQYSTLEHQKRGSSGKKKRRENKENLEHTVLRD